MKNTLLISDTHAPHQHPQALKFIEAAKDTYGCEDAFSVGDIFDFHNASFHANSHGVVGAKEEFEGAYSFVKKLEEIYPKLIVTLGNHDKLNIRKAESCGISPEHLRSFNDIFDVPKWKFVDKHMFNIDTNMRCMIVHQISSSMINNAKILSHSSISGHFHSNMGLVWHADTEHLRFHLSVGCLIDDNSPAFSYNKLSVSKRPLIGMAAIVDNLPIIIPMRMKKSGKWDGRV